MKTWTNRVLLAAVTLTASSAVALIGVDSVPACSTEDSSNCYWDASHRGNGQGRSFVDVAGTPVYLPW